jgi:hypothetical protein
MSDELVRRAEQVEQEGRQRYAEDWPKFVDAISRMNPNGIAPEAMHAVLGQQNAADILAAGGKEALINLSDAGDKEAEYIYNEIRQRERKSHRLLRGRGPA